MKWLRLLVLAALLTHASPARAEMLETQVNRAIERGVAITRTYLDGNGVGRTRYHGEYPDGDTALVLFTLVKSGVFADDPLVKKSAAWLADQPMKRTYSAAMYILALDAFKDHAYDGKIQAAAKWLEDRFLEETKSRRWSYPGTHTDLSNTQYGALGLWTAERHGFKSREDTWAALLSGVTDLRMPDEGFAYRSDSRTTGAMTVAGVTVLELALARAPDGQLPARFADIRHKAAATLEKAWGYLDRRFSVEGNPLGAHGFQEDWFEYYLYGVERLCAITGKEKIGEHEWYAEGARKLVATQHADGSWGDAVNTCFALLFLRRATLTSVDRQRKPLEGEGVAAAPKPPEHPHGDVPFIRRWLALGPIDDPDDELLEKSFFVESRASPQALSYSGSNRWQVLRSLRDQVDLGDPAHSNGEGEPLDHVITCLFTWLHVAEDADVVFWFGHDDGCRVWLDGKLVHDRHFEGNTGADRFFVPALLTPGAHRLLMKVQNYKGGHCAWMRIAKPDGRPAVEVTPSLSPEDLELDQAAVANPKGLPLDDLLLLLPRDRRLHPTFDTEAELACIAFDGEDPPYPLWSADPSKRKSHVPNPGATGVFAFHPVDREHPCTAYWKVKVPERPRLRLRVSATTTSAPNHADALLKIGVYDGAMHWLATEQVGPNLAADATGWNWIETDLAAFEGKEVLVVLAAANGGKVDWSWEGIWIDEMEIHSGI